MFRIKEYKNKLLRDRLKEIHDNNIIYRNIDPNKIYIANGNIVKVGDSTDIRSLLCITHLSELILP